MKRLCTIALVVSLVLGTSVAGASLAVRAQAEQNAAAQAETASVYLVPGSYQNGDRETVYNTVPTGATKLTDAESAAIYTPNAYLCTAQAGQELPTPVSAQEGFTFNGWWTIENATVAYHATVPETAGVMFLYADWRAELSQPMDPVNPPADAEEEIPHYMEITRAATGNKEIIPLYISGTDIPNAEQFGYGGPVQLYNEWFLLQPGDIMRIYVSKLYGSKPTIAPQMRNNQAYAKLEANKVNSTYDYLMAKLGEDQYHEGIHGDETSFLNDDPGFGYVGVKATQEHYFRIYIKFYDAGGSMTIYMEKQDK